MFPIVCEYKGVKIRKYGNTFCVVYEKGKGKQIVLCKTVISAKRWITSNKVYIGSSVIINNRTDIDLVRYTIFY